MSIWVSAWASQVKAPLTSHEQIVLDKLADHCSNADGTGCFPSMETLARESRLSRATVWRILDRLEYVHVLIRKETSGKQKGRSNHYRLLVDSPQRLPSEIPEGSPMDPVVPAVPNLFDIEQGVASDATGGVSPRDTLRLVDNSEKVSRHATPVSRQRDRVGVASRDRGVASSATPGVASDATRTVIEPSITKTACETSTNGHHFDANIGDWVCCNATAPGCMLFAHSQRTIETGRNGIAMLRAQLAAKSNSVLADVDSALNESAVR
jgi:hypothetical protein